MITHEKLISSLVYEKDSGNFFWRKSGRRAGFISCGGRYWGVGIERHTYKRSRLAWFYINGTWPTMEIDHIDGDRLNDRITNLRDVSHSQNLANLPRHREGYLVGTTYVKCCKRVKRWLSRVKKGGKTKILGYFLTQKEAHDKYIEYITNPTN